MAVEKGKVKAALDAKFKGKSVSKELKDSLAARWADKIENDEGIDTYINDREDDILDAAKEADRRATAAAEKAKKEAADAVTGKPKPEPNAEPQSDPDMPAWAKQLLDANKTLTEKVSAFEASKSAESIAERFRKEERLKGIPEMMFKGRVPKSEEEYDAAVEELSKDYQDFATTNKVQRLGADSPGKATTTGGDPKATDEQVNRMLDRMAV